MRLRVLPVLLPVAVFGIAVSQEGSESARARIVDEIHQKLQGQFNDISDPDRGFGATRIEINKILRHPVGNAGGYREEGWSVGIQIFGNDGKPLDAAKLKPKYTRIGGESRTQVVANPAAEALKKLKKGQKEPFIWKQQDTVVEARFFRLTDKKCLGCHTGMKLGDPVAIGVYRAARIDNKVKP